MYIDITELKNGNESTINVQEKVEISNEVFNDTDIISLKEANIKGYVSRDPENNYYLDLVLSGTMVLPCSITLQPVDYPFSAEISGEYLELMLEIENNVQNVENSLDIFPLIWENILMEIPIKVTCPDATDLKLSGDGWKLVTDGEEEGTTSAFDKLKELL